MENKIFNDAILSSLVDNTFLGNKQIGPDILTNTEDESIWLTLKQELLNCSSFTWAVAFITQDMLVPLKVLMSDLEKQGINGTIITSTYLNFNDPKVFLELQKIKNLNVKIADQSGFHAKVYLFNHQDYQTLIIGSANFTRAALLSNYELSLKLSSRNNSAITTKLKKQIDKLIKNSVCLTNEWIKNYQSSWIAQSENVKKSTNKETTKIIPNQMQQQALKQLNLLKKSKATRALVISATGTGKTYLGAFAVKQAAPKHFLYLVHRQQISKKTLESFYQVIGGKESDYGLLSANNHDLNKKYLFATVQTMSQQKILERLNSKHFDYILIDEAHRVAAPSYQKILRKLKPKFLLGMTATPERMDNQDIYKIFDYNLAYEIRLSEALKEKMLTPFHYVGVQDYEVAGFSVDETSNLKFLVNEARVKYILKELEYYGYSGPKAKGLIFCSRQDEAYELARIFTNRGYKARALTNQDSEKKRSQVVKELKDGDIEYIFSVDLFNEGIDIPSLNQIVMLRNTQSSIVFIQQLGRGLRKYQGKEFTLIIDFIGNYKNNYLIPIALNNDKSRDIDKVRREIKQPPFIDVSTINFSKIASKKILASLDRVKLDSIKELRDAYKDLFQKIGRVPLMEDFYNYGSVNPIIFTQNSNFKNYGTFLSKMGNNLQLSKYDNQVLTFLTQELVNGKRPHELLLLKLLLENNSISILEYKTKLSEYGTYLDKGVLESVNNFLSLDFFNIKQGKTTKKEQYGNTALIEEKEFEYSLNNSIKQSLKENKDFKKLFKDAVMTGLLMNKKYEPNQQFTLYQQYSRKDSCHLLNWPKDVSAPMYGYRIGDKECPIFITYKKNEKKKRNFIYQNSLENGHSLRWYTRSPRHLNSAEVKKLIAGVQIHLFVKESDAAGKEFYYLGRATIQENSIKEEQIGAKKKPVVGMNLILDHPLELKIKTILFD